MVDGMKDYESAFLGLILAGVLMMVVGLGLLMPTAARSDSPRVSLAERRDGACGTGMRDLRHRRAETTSD